MILASKVGALSLMVEILALGPMISALGPMILASKVGALILILRVEILALATSL